MLMKNKTNNHRRCDSAAVTRPAPQQLRLSYPGELPSSDGEWMESSQGLLTALRRLEFPLGDTEFATGNSPKDSRKSPVGMVTGSLNAQPLEAFRPGRQPTDSAGGKRPSFSVLYASDERLRKLTGSDCARSGFARLCASTSDTTQLFIHLTEGVLARIDGEVFEINGFRNATSSRPGARSAFLAGAFTAMWNGRPEDAALVGLAAQSWFLEHDDFADWNEIRHVIRDHRRVSREEFLAVVELDGSWQSKLRHKIARTCSRLGLRPPVALIRITRTRDSATDTARPERLTGLLNRVGVC